jgi:hypothetical protein
LESAVISTGIEELKWRLYTTYRMDPERFSLTTPKTQDENISFESKYESGDHYNTGMYLLPAYVADLTRLSNK